MELISSGLYCCSSSFYPTHDCICSSVFLLLWSTSPTAVFLFCVSSRLHSSAVCFTSLYPPLTLHLICALLSSCQAFLPLALQSRFISVHDSFCSISSKVSRFVHLPLSPSSLLPPKKAIVIQGGTPSEQILSGHFMYKHVWLSITKRERNEKVWKKKGFV